MSMFLKKKESEDDQSKKKEKEEKKEKRKERKKKLRAAQANVANVSRMEEEELKWWKEKKKKHAMTRMKFLSEEELVRVKREEWMDCKEHEVAMLNISIAAKKLKRDRLTNEHRSPMEMFWLSWDRKQIVKSRMGEKQKEEVKKIVNGEDKVDEK
jgi:hypothetical protein